MCLKYSVIGVWFFMSLYETVFIIRQDVSSADVDKLTAEFTEVISKLGGKILKTEYWGLRNLAYDISNNKKGHYVMLCSESDDAYIKELERKMKFSEDVIRYLTLKVDSISNEPSPILKGQTDSYDNIIDVTAN